MDEVELPGRRSFTTDATVAFKSYLGPSDQDFAIDVGDALNAVEGTLFAGSLSRKYANQMLLLVKRSNSVTGPEKAIREAIMDYLEWLSQRWNR